MKAIDASAGDSKDTAGAGEFPIISIDASGRRKNRPRSASRLEIDL